jgi:opacity protein-like surface antigen
MCKKFRLTAVLIFVSLFFTVSSAHADIRNGWYIGGSVGGGIVNDSDYNFLNNPGNGTMENGSGIILNAAAGYKFGMPRLEGEIAYLKNDIDQSMLNGIPATGVDGDTKTVSFLVNGYLDFENKTRFTPFINLGLGFAKIDSNLTISGNRAYDDSETVFSYQAGAGVGIDLAPNWILDLKYGYFGTSDPELSDTSGNKFEFEYSSHRLSIGVRYSF